MFAIEEYKQDAEVGAETTSDSLNLRLLNQLYQYDFDERHLPSGFSVGVTQFALLFSVLASLVYAFPASQFKEFGDSEAQITLNEIDSCYAAWIVLCAAAIDFYYMHLGQQFVPEELKSIIKPRLTMREFVQDSGIIGLMSAVCSAPFVLIMLTYSQIKNKNLWIAYATLVGVANTLLHFLPVKLWLRDPIFGYPLRQFLKFCAWVSCYQPSAEELAISAENERIATLLGPKIAHFNRGVSRYLSYLANNPESAKAEIDKISTSSIENLFVQIAQFSDQQEVPPFSSTVIGCTQGVGMLTQVTGCFGYLANTYLAVYVELHSVWQSVLATCAPIYFLSNLLAYFGGLTAMRLLYDVLFVQAIVRERRLDAVEWPAIFKLYPASLAVCMVINAFLLAFSATAAQAMLQGSVGPYLPDAVMYPWYSVAQLAVCIVAWYMPLDYQRRLLGYWAVYMEKGGAHEIMLFEAKCAALARKMECVQGGALATTLANAIPEPKKFGDTSAVSEPSGVGSRPAFYPRDSQGESDSVRARLCPSPTKNRGFCCC